MKCVLIQWIQQLLYRISLIEAMNVSHKFGSIKKWCEFEGHNLIFWSKKNKLTHFHVTERTNIHHFTSAWIPNGSIAPKRCTHPRNPKTIYNLDWLVSKKPLHTHLVCVKFRIPSVSACHPTQSSSSWWCWATWRALCDYCKFDYLNKYSSRQSNERCRNDKNSHTKWVMKHQSGK